MIMQTPALLPMPMLALWGDKGAIEAHFDCLAPRHERAMNVRGRALPGGGYLAEECPDVVLAEWQPFLADVAARSTNRVIQESSGNCV